MAKYPTITDEQVMEMLSSMRDYVISEYNRTRKSISLREYGTMIMKAALAATNIRKARALNYGQSHFIDYCATEANKAANKQSFIDSVFDTYLMYRDRNATGMFAKRYGDSAARQCEAKAQRMGF